MGMQEPLIHLDTDSDDPSPLAYARRLAEAAPRAGEAADKYGEGEVVRAAERLIAARLGKEKAVLFATGTLANMIALDRLCPRFARRVLMHPESHVLADTGDGAAGVMGLTPEAVAADGPGFTPEAARTAIRNARIGRVRQGIGAMVIETPVRRRFNELFPIAQLDAVLAVAREEGVAAHLDGARLPIAATAARRALQDFCAPFETVYLSLWKMLGLPYGAALAGPAALLEGIEHDRRRHGGALPQLWPLAVMTLADLDARLDQWPAIFERFARVRAALVAHPRIVLRDVGREAGNTAWLEVTGADPHALRASAARARLALPEPQGPRFAIRANASWLAIAPDALAARLAAAIDAA
jgi:threonine aldolase